MVQFIADHRAVFGVEPICAVLPIAPSTYHRHRHQRTHPTRRSARAQRDDQLRVEIQRVYDEHQQVYGPRKVWKQLRRDGVRVARCTVARRWWRMRAGLRASNRRARHLPMRYETGLPSSVIRFRTLHASTASRRCPDELRARRQSPTIDVYRKNAFSTRAC